MNKKAVALLGAIFVLILGLLGFLLFQNYSGKKDPSPATDQTSTTTPVTDNNEDPATGNQDTGSVTPTTTPEVIQNTVVRLSDIQVVSPILFYNGSGVTFFTSQGELYQADFLNSGQTLALTRQRNLNIKQKSGLAKILWPPTGNNFITQINGVVGPVWSFFNSKTGEYTDLPSQVTNLDWMPNGDKIMYIWVDSGKASLNIADGDTKNFTKIANMWELDDKISISPDGSTVLYYETTSSSSTNPIYSVSSDGKVWKTPVSTGYNYGVLWSPDSQKFLYGKKDISTGNFQLWYFNILTGEFKNLGLSTVPDKSVWGTDSQTVYAAVPKLGSALGGGLTQDGFVRINTATLDQKAFENFPQQVDGENLFLSPDGTKLLFRNSQDGYLYYLDISQ